MTEINQTINNSKIFNCELKAVLISDVRVDQEYQRKIDTARLSKNVKAFSAGAAKAISLSQRSDGSLWCYDGHHTLECFREMGFTSVPALVVRGSQKQEAEWFVLMNGGGAKRVSQREIFIAGKTAQETSSVEADRLLKKFGLTVSSGGNRSYHTSAIGFIREKVKKQSHELCQTMLLIDRLWRKEKEAWSRSIMHGIFMIVVNGYSDQVERGLKKYKISPRRILDMAQGMQVATGNPGGGLGVVRNAIYKLAKVDQNCEA